MEEKNYQLKLIQCLDCEQEFEYTAGEQRFNESLFVSGKIPVCADPKRCRECRAQRKKIFDRAQKYKKDK